MDRKTAENQRQVISDENTTRGRKNKGETEKNDAEAENAHRLIKHQIFGTFLDDSE
jgi:hypothetical protein